MPDPQLYVTDTHSLLWYLYDLPQLAPAAQAAFSEVENGEAIRKAFALFANFRALRGPNACPIRQPPVARAISFSTATSSSRQPRSCGSQMSWRPTTARSPRTRCSLSRLG